MKHYIFFFVFFLTVFSLAAVKPQAQDTKLPTQAMLEHQVFGAPAASSATTALNANAGPTSAALKVVSTFAAQPDVARNIVVTPGGTTTDVEACVVTVAGTNFKGVAITETFTFIADQSTAVTGNKAFKSITSVSWPANCESGGFAATWSVGIGSKIGLKNCLASAGDWAWSKVAGAYEATRATVAVNASAVESNTAIFNGVLNGSNVFDAYFVQNFRCQ
jgi:hypothetical protein